MEHFVEEAFRIALAAEISSYRIYSSAAAMLPDERGKEVFERLALEQSKVIDEILKQCPKTVVSAIERQKDQQFAAAGEGVLQAPQARLFDHLRVALLQKNACIDRYAAFATAFREPGICRVFQMALTMARRQYHLIAREYRCVDEHLNRPGSNRRVKRTHLRGVNRPAPNKHSQLFVSLLDSCRPSPFLR